ncbi:MAG: hypothetical protein AB1410_08305 [Acidobacteriota bacterium]
MTIIILAINLVVFLFISYPIIIKKYKHEIYHKIDERLKELLSQKVSLYETIKDLEFDYKMGKLSREDYEELEKYYRLKALSFLKDIDRLGKQDIENQIEKEVLALRQKKKRNI